MASFLYVRGVGETFGLLLLMASRWCLSYLGEFPVLAVSWVRIRPHGIKPKQESREHTCQGARGTVYMHKHIEVKKQNVWVTEGQKK